MGRRRGRRLRGEAAICQEQDQQDRDSAEDQRVDRKYPNGRFSPNAKYLPAQ